MENNLPQGWAWFDMLDVIDYEGGSQPPKKVFTYEPKKGYVRLVQIRDYGDKPFPTYVPDSTRLKKAEKDDLLIARYGGSSANDSLGRICSGIEGAYNVALAKVIFPKQFLNTSFVRYLLSGPWFKERLNSLSRSCQTGFNREDLHELYFPLPPLAEQHRIVNKLDAVMQKVESNKQRLEKIPKLLKRFRQSVLAAAVSGKLTEEWRERNKFKEWVEVELNSVIPKGGIFDGPFGSNLKTADYTDKGIRVIRLENIEHLYFVHEKETYITKEKFRTLIRHTVGEGDIIFSSFISEEIRACILPNLPTKAIAKADCFCIRPDEALIDKFFLLYVLISLRSYEQLVLNIHGATRPRINTTQLKALSIPLPELEEQKEIVRRVEQLFAYADKIERRYTKAKAMLDKLPQSILAKAFRGELVAQDPNDEPASVLLERIKKEKEKLIAEKKGKKSKGYSIKENPLKIAAEKKVKYKKRKPL